MRISDLENFEQAVSDYSVTQSHLILNYVDNDETIAPTTYKITLNNLGKALSKDSKLLYYNSNNKALLSYVKNPAEPQEDQDPPPPYVTETVGYYLNSTDKDVVAGAVTNIAYDATNKKITQTKYGTTTTDVVSISTLKTDLQLVKGDVDLGNVDNKSSATIRSELTSSNVTTALGYTPANSANLGTAAAKNVPSTGNAGLTEVVMGDDSRLTDARNAADVYSWAKAETKPTYTASEVGALPADTTIPSIEGLAPTASPTFTTQITIGSTTLTEAQLQALIEMIPSGEE